MVSIDGSYIEDNSNDGFISTNALYDIKDGNQIHPELKRRDARLRIRDHIKQMKNEWKVTELSAKRMEKRLLKLFKAVVNELKNELPTLGKAGSEVSRFIP